MKKKYEKPQVFFEQYELSHSVANCSTALNHSQDECTLDAGEAPNLVLGQGETIFNSENCLYTMEGLGYEDYCYWTGESVNNIFTS